MAKIIYMNDTIIYMQRCNMDITKLVKSGEVFQKGNLMYLVINEKVKNGK